MQIGWVELVQFRCRRCVASPLPTDLIYHSRPIGVVGVNCASHLPSRRGRDWIWRKAEIHPWRSAYSTPLESDRSRFQLNRSGSEVRSSPTLGASRILRRTLLYIRDFS
jgi:hypothetical protein